MASEGTSSAPKQGALVRDTQRGRVGVMMAVHDGHYYLRPQGGGCEWRARPREVQPLTPEEALSAKVAEANRRSENGRGAA